MTAILADIQANPLAAAVLAALVAAEISAVWLVGRARPVRVAGGGHAGWLAAFTLLGLPASLDLLQNGGVVFVFALIVLVIFGVNILMALLNFTGRVSHALVADWYTWAVPVLVLAGLVVAGYLTYAEVTATTPVCGAVITGCHLVQASPYSKLFGVVPVGGVGLAGYVAVFIAWGVWRWGAAPLQKAGRLATWAVCFLGVLFSAYLTYLELAVIGATCVWCITSAVLMLLLLWVATPAAQAVFVAAADLHQAQG